MAKTFGRRILLETATDVHNILVAAKIPHVVIGGFATILHGYREKSRDVDVLVREGDRAKGLDSLKAAGYGWISNRRTYASPSGVRVDLRPCGESGDNVALPDPESAGLCEEIEGLPVITLGRLLQNKLACGLWGQRKGATAKEVERSLKHFADVVGLIKVKGLLPP